MDNKHKIFGTYDELCLLISEFQKKGTFSLIEKDLTLEKLRDLYALINREETFDVLTTGSFKEEEEEDRKDQVQTEENENVETTENAEDNIEESYASELKEAETSTVFKENTEKKETENISEEQLLGEKYKGSKKFRDELFSEHHPSKDIALKLQSRPIDDIGKAVGLNDKFLYINQLFRGDSSLFKKTLEKLNTLNDFNDAFSYLNEQFNWNMKDETTQKFMELVRRKFITPVK